MSEEDVEVVRRAMAEFDESHRLSESFAPDFVWDTRTDRVYPEQKEFRGWDGFFEFLKEWVDPYDEWDNQIDDVLDAGGGRVAVVAHQRGRLQGSRTWVETFYGLVYTVEEGLIRRIQVYDTPEEALEAAGLRE